MSYTVNILGNHLVTGMIYSAYAFVMIVFIFQKELNTLRKIYLFKM